MLASTCKNLSMRKANVVKKLLDLKSFTTGNVYNKSHLRFTSHCKGEPLKIGDNSSTKSFVIPCQADHKTCRLRFVFEYEVINIVNQPTRSINKVQLLSKLFSILSLQISIQTKCSNSSSSTEVIFHLASKLLLPHFLFSLSSSSLY